MRVFTLGVALAACLGLAAARASAQSVQLPTFSFTTVTTTVSVPDGGAAYLGGISRAAEGRNEYGVPGLAFPGFQNRGIGQDRSASSMWVTATIHDFDAMDQALLGAPSPEGFAQTYPRTSRDWAEGPGAIAVRNFQKKSGNLASDWRVRPETPATGSDYATEHANRVARRTTRAEEADNFFAQGQQAEAEGKPKVAKIYYQMALRRAAGELKQQVLARLDAVSGRTTAVAKNAP